MGMPPTPKNRLLTIFKNMEGKHVAYFESDDDRHRASFTDKKLVKYYEDHVVSDVILKMLKNNLWTHITYETLVDMAKRRTPRFVRKVRSIGTRK